MIPLQAEIDRCGSPQHTNTRERLQDLVAIGMQMEETGQTKTERVHKQRLWAIDIE